MILPARPRKPQDKAKVESGVQVVERWILARLRHRQFFSVAELDAAVAELLPALNDRPFKKLPGCRREAFALLDAPYLRPLPATAFVLAEWKRAGVNIDYHVEFDDNYYSVPHALVRQEVELRITRSTRRGAGQRAPGRQSSRAATAKATSRPSPNTCRRRIGRMPSGRPGRLMNWAASVGPATAELVKRLLMEKQHPEQGYRVLPGLDATGAQPLAGAHGGAPAHGPWPSAPIATARSPRFWRRDWIASPLAPPAQAELALPDHANVRGPGYYH